VTRFGAEGENIEADTTGTGKMFLGQYYEAAATNKLVEFDV
jgi:hypothetical protein